MIFSTMKEELKKMFEKDEMKVKCPRCAGDVPQEDLIVNGAREIVGCKSCLEWNEE